MIAFFALACGLTWLLAFPLTYSWIQQTVPPAYAVPMAGLSAFGPTLAAAAVAWPHGELRTVFGRWRAPVVWVVLGLFAPMALHSVANVLELAFGGHPTQWFHPPSTPEHLAALVVFSFGEELGWRGFAYPRLAQRFGAVNGSLLLGVVWALWHLGYAFSPIDGSFGLAAWLMFFVELPLYSVVIAWLFERSNRSLTVAVAIHMGAHLDNAGRIPDSELRIRWLGLLVVAIVAVFAARSLRAGLARPAAARSLDPRGCA
jgi:membrane protease YdiL (CAAX protease family)